MCDLKSDCTNTLKFINELLETSYFHFPHYFESEDFGFLLIHFSQIGSEKREIVFSYESLYENQ